jgi:hypothetical protein
MKIGNSFLVAPAHGSALRAARGQAPSLYCSEITNDISPRAAERWIPASAEEANEEAEVGYVHNL